MELASTNEPTLVKVVSSPNLPIESIEDSGELSNWLDDPSNDGQLVKTKLSTSDRVIARVTDGIYRQPASALRELISNAWDADASTVTILTDAPRFSRIYIRDNGRGMSNEALTRLIKNIGGSAKRREEGQSLGITASHDTNLTPGGRPIIGKIGIGLFSVSQLARNFQITTKVKGSNYRMIAEVRLRQYSEDGEDEADTESEDKYMSGDVFLRRDNTDDTEAHGTDIVLEEVKKPVRDLLRSASRWQSVEEKQTAESNGEADDLSIADVEPPIFHSGYIKNLNDPIEQPSLLKIAPEYPWTNDDAPAVRMDKLVDAVEGQFTRTARPDLNSTLDTYLEMIWSLGLSAPVQYVSKHPFDLSTHDLPLRAFWITDGRGRGKEINLESGRSIREAVSEQIDGAPKLVSGDDPLGGFKVFIDGLELRRPIRFKYHSTGERGLNHAVMFVGAYAPDLSQVSNVYRGGKLSLEGYLFWTGRVIPKENNGVLVRIRDTSGALFDPTFFNYQVSELTRLRQITSELFVIRGLDAALNIDRESFNYAHPHVQLVARWQHAAIRQLTNRVKSMAADKLLERRNQKASEVASELMDEAAKLWRQRQGSEPPPVVVLANSPIEALAARQDGAIAVERSALSIPVGRKSSTEMDSKTTALITALAAFGVLEDRTYDEQQKLIRAILAIFADGAT
ncbi:hypothetical protein L53_01015 [Hyphomonas sp. L-53-1-40]|uniref:ATP-binding protein n=1 Tax=Hyphomonas sp. L-53-1-40 TaxID=1207058 RepID=UPI000458B3D1|nr:ATP-binding protein [Hyphomonas sp. L-53-1-40]KCZ65920.1 hypothetical protein L53_01015 [Hyphomonas sp. L-53-1-40]